MLTVAQEILQHIWSVVIGGVISMAGSNRSGYNDGIGSNARFNDPRGVVCTSDGSKVVVADESNHRLRLIHTATNEVITIAGDGKSKHSDGIALAAGIATPYFMAFDRTTFRPDSMLYITCGVFGCGSLRRFDFISGAVLLTPALGFSTCFLFLLFVYLKSCVIPLQIS